MRLARKIALQVKSWTGQGWQPRDIIVLVRQRGALFESIIRALKAADIPVAGADRLILTEHIAVMDMMALADALLLPEDDLALASVLKSPLFGLGDNELFGIAWNRGKLPLRAALAAQARDDLLLADTARMLDASDSTFLLRCESLFLMKCASSTTMPLKPRRDSQATCRSSTS